MDIYVLHRDDPSLPVGPIVEVLNEHHAAGRIKAFGGSNWHHTRIQEANEYAESTVWYLLQQAAQLQPGRAGSGSWGPGCVTIGGPKEVNPENGTWKPRPPYFLFKFRKGILFGKDIQEKL